MKAITSVVAALIVVIGDIVPLAKNASEDPLARSIAAYAALKSYADTGTIAVEMPGLVDRSKFKTFYRRDSADFFLEYQGVTSGGPGRSDPQIDMSGQRMVLWMMNGELEAYNAVFQTHESYPKETANQPGVLIGASAGTNGASVLIPGLLYAKANLPSPIREIEQGSDGGFEAVDGRRCQKIMGIASEYYPSGQRVNVRQVTVWIDAETLLIRKVFEDTPKGYPIGQFLRKTVTIVPQANPTLDDAKFKFNVPKTTR